MSIVALDNLRFEERQQRSIEFSDRFEVSDKTDAYLMRSDCVNLERRNGSRGEVGPGNRSVRVYDDGEQGGWMPQGEYLRMINSCVTYKKQKQCRGDLYV